MPEILLDALLDTLKLLPFFFVIYIFIEFIETKSAARAVAVRLLSGKFSPVAASCIGLVPQCGFSVMATNLYDGGYILPGTLLSVYLATSDEALPILLSHLTESGSAAFDYIWKLLLIKFIYAALIGFVVNAALRALAKNKNLFTDSKTDAQLENVDLKPVKDRNLHINTTHSSGCCSHDFEHGQRTVWQFIRHPIFHTLKVAFYVLVVNIVFGTIIYFIGRDALAAFMLRAYFAQPFFAALIGLIPNCASAVLLTEMLLSGTLSFPAAVAGLCANSGIAVAVLFKNRTRLKSNLLILGALYFFGVFIGTMLSLFM